MGTLGLVGVGLLGSALAERLLAGGFDVVGYDLQADRREALTAAGGRAAPSAAAVFDQCRQVVLCLPDAGVVATLADSLQEHLQGGMLLVDTSTGDPAATAALGASLAARHVDYVDATIAGSSAVVRQGRAVVMAGGSAEAFRSAGDILACIAAEVFHVGPVGAGARMKLVVNLVLGLNRAALAEGLALAKAYQLDGPTTLAVLKAGAAYSAAMDAKGEKMLAGDFTPQARLSQHLKDVRLMLAAAGQLGIELPLSVVHGKLLEQAEAAGWGEFDNSAILRAYDRAVPERTEDGP